jgi:hypothetical protein
MISKAEEEDIRDEERRAEAARQERVQNEKDVQALAQLKAEKDRAWSQVERSPAASTLRGVKRYLQDAKIAHETMSESTAWAYVVSALADIERWENEGGQVERWEVD